MAVIVMRVRLTARMAGVTVRMDRYLSLLTRNISACFVAAPLLRRWGKSHVPHAKTSSVGAGTPCQHRQKLMAHC